MRITKWSKKAARMASLIFYSVTLLVLGGLAERLIPEPPSISRHLAYIGVFAVLTALTFGLACFTEEEEAEV